MLLSMIAFCKSCNFLRAGVQCLGAHGVPRVSVAKKNRCAVYAASNQSKEIG